MKKQILILIGMFLCIWTFYAEDLKSFNGIDFGSSYENANEIMLSKGWKNLGKTEKNEFVSVVTYFNGTYAGLDIKDNGNSKYKDKLQLIF